MEASIVDLRYHMNTVLQALDRNESVRVLYRGKLKGTLVPATMQKKKYLAKDHPCFGMIEGASGSVEDEINALRRPRYAV